VPIKGYKSITFSEETVEKVRKLSEILGCSMTELITNAIESYITSVDFKKKILEKIEKRKEELQRIEELAQQIS